MNVIVDNTSNKKIETYFPDGCRFDAYLDYQLNDSSIEITTVSGTYGEACLAVIIPLKFLPGSSIIMDELSIKVNDSSLTDLPSGYYEVVFGEESVKINSYFDKSTSASFQINDGVYRFDFPDRPSYETSIDIKAVIFSPMLFYVIIYIIRRRSKINR